MISFARLPENFGGTASKGYEKVFDIFKQNFKRGLEREGAAVAVYHNGELVVDIWGGYMDKENQRKWERDTLAIVMSCSKAVTAIVVAMLVDRGLLSYDDLVSKHWPEFSQNGKENVTVKMLMCHQAGVVTPDEAMTFEVLSDWKVISKIFEVQKPYWIPDGKTYGYHASSLGFLADQLVRRVDPQRRSIGQFLKEEITTPYDIDFCIGLHPSEWHRMARLRRPGVSEAFSRIADPRFLKFVCNFFCTGNPRLLEKAFANPHINLLYMPMGFLAEVPAANGVGTARGLAKIFSLLAEGKLISSATLDKICMPVNGLDGAPDRVVGVPLVGGWGFTHVKRKNRSDYIFGHGGYGGSVVRVDLAENLAVAYIRNGLEHEHEQAAPTKVLQRLGEAIYECIEAQKAAANKSVNIRSCQNLTKRNGVTTTDHSSANGTVDTSLNVNCRVHAQQTATTSDIDSETVRISANGTNVTVE